MPGGSSASWPGCAAWRCRRATCPGTTRRPPAIRSPRRSTGRSGSTAPPSSRHSPRRPKSGRSLSASPGATSWRILSNWPLAVTIDRYVEAAGWAPHVRAIVVSQRVGTIKPDPAIFAGGGGGPRGERPGDPPRRGRLGGGRRRGQAGRLAGGLDPRPAGRFAAPVEPARPGDSRRRRGRRPGPRAGPAPGPRGGAPRLTLGAGRAARLGRDGIPRPDDEPRPVRGRCRGLGPGRARRDDARPASAIRSPGSSARC